MESTHQNTSRQSGPSILYKWPQKSPITSTTDHHIVIAHLKNQRMRAGILKETKTTVGETQAARAAGVKPTKVVGVFSGRSQAARAAGGRLGMPSLPLVNCIIALYITALLILLASDVELNPGPRKIKYPCQICEKAVTWKQRGVACDDCNCWYHVECMHMSTPVYMALNNISWHCVNCGLPNFSTNLFESTIISNSNSFSVLDHSRLSQDDTQSSPGPPLQSSSPTQPQRQNRPPSHMMKIININFQSVKNKKEEILNLIDQSDPSIIIGTETWLTPNICSSEIFPPTYEIIRKDRPNGYGGVLLAVKKDYTAENLELEVTDTECIFTKLKLGRNNSLIIGSIYRPPSSDSTYMDKICETIEKVHQENRNAVLWIGGDLNLPDINWQQQTQEGNQVHTAINSRFLDMVQNCCLTQMVDFPTRGDNTLDLFLTNRPGLIQRCTPIPGISDHDAVFIESRAIAVKNRPVKRKIQLWKRANLTKLKEDCRTFQQHFINKYTNITEASTTRTEAMWKDIYSNLQEIVNNNVPSKMSSSRFNQPWITREIKQLSRKKKKYFVKARSTQKEEDFQKYKEIKTATRLACKKAYREYIETMIAPDSTSNPKRFWSFINSKKTESSGVAALKANDGLTYSDPSRKANILNSQFSSVFNSNEPADNIVEPMSVNSQMPDITVTEAGVSKLLRNLKIHKATGPDGISTRILKELYEELAPIYTMFFQTSINEGVVPSEWKKADVVPIYKKGPKSKAENYRPVSLTSVSCKLLEHIITSSIMRYLESNNILTDLQHGFRKRRSCETQLITTINDLATTMDTKSQTDLILLDFSKAFDKVPHKRLIKKLQNYGIRGNINRWITDFLRDRTQQVVLEGEKSDVAPVMSGVPQGSVLGPTLFLIYINDLPSYLSQGSQVRLFADDCVLYRKVENGDDTTKLQTDLDDLQRWEDDWMMEFHPQKCQVLNITNKRHPIKKNYTIHNQVLETVESAKYLGITIHNKLNWNTHINQVVKKANNSRAFLQRNINQCPSKTKQLCYKALVRPQMEYASVVWDPHTSANINKLEMVQRRSARFITGDYHRTSSVTAMMDNLKLLPLQKRRKNDKLLMFYKIIHGLVAVPTDCLIRTTSSVRGHNQRYIIPHTRTQVLQTSFFPDTTRLWNSLPLDTVNTESFEVFKSSINKL